MIVAGADLLEGVITDISLVPSSVFVQEITTYTITFTTDKNMFAPGFIHLRFADNFILP